MSGRPSREEYFLRIAEVVLERSTCLLRKYGAVIVVGDTIVSTGYNGPARGMKHCDEFGFCLKELANMPKGTGYDFCPAVHAEENAIINAARSGVSLVGGTLYIAGRDARTGELTEAMPCERCRRAIINAGIASVVIRTSDGGLRRVDPRSWVAEEEKRYLEKAEALRRSRG